MPTHLIQDTPSSLTHVRVVELGGPFSHYCGKVFADLGADVVKVEPNGGDPTRSLAPFAHNDPNQEKSLYFLNHNLNKRSVALDLDNPRDREQVRRIANSSDILIESFNPGYLNGIDLGFESLSQTNQGITMASITPFGQTGPYSQFLGNDLIAQAMGGLMYSQGDDNKPPCAAPCEQASQLASMHAAYGALAALRYRASTGQGQHVDVSVQETVAHMMLTIPRYAYFGDIARRPGIASPVAPNGFYKCSDGYVCISVFFDDHWIRMIEWMGLDSLDDPIWHDGDFRRANPDLIDELVSEFAIKMSVEKMVEEGQKRRLVVCPMNSLDAVINGNQLKSREYFEEVEHPITGKHRYPGAPYRLSHTPWKIKKAAPLLAENQEEILQELSVHVNPLSFTEPGLIPSDGKLPLSGVRILDFSRVWAGPFATRYLADLGAEVIKVESDGFLDTLRTSTESAPLNTEINRNKLGITVNFANTAGQELVHRLVQTSDVVMENFSGGVMDRRGLGYDVLRSVNPSIITVSMPGFGSTGPAARQLSYGQSLMAYSGLAILWGYPDSPYEARPKVHYPDFMSASAAATAIVAALEYRHETGRGQQIEVPQSESVISSMGVAVLDYIVNGKVWEPMGNRSLNAAPHGCYPCRGEDQWCVISCENDDHWRRLRSAIGDPEWAKNVNFETLQSRLNNQSELDDEISQWTCNYSPYQVMRHLQKHSVPAGAVQSGEQVYRDYHMRSRGFIIESNHKEWDRLETAGIVVGLSRSPGRISRGMPEVGEHNYLVFRHLLGIEPAEFEQLSKQGVLR